MKTKTILLSAFALATISANSQKGSWYVGGNLGFGTSQSKSDNGTIIVKGGKSTNWSFSPEIGTFVTNNIQVGAGLTYSANKFDNQQTIININKNSAYGATLYSRYFFGKEAFKPFAGLNVSGLSGRSKQTIGTNTTNGPKSFTLSANINAGFGYAISKRVTTIGSFGFLGFSSSTQKQGTSKNTTTSFGLDAGTLGSRFNVGFYYTICN